MKVEFIDNAESQYDDSADRIRGIGKGKGKLFLGDRSSASMVQLKHRKIEYAVRK